MSEPFAIVLVRQAPPWLQRLVGAKVLGAIGAMIDTLATRIASSVKLRLPNVATDTSLGHLGRDRRIRRGPGEAAATYALRLRRWWDAHRTRGSAFELARQLWAFHKAELDVRFDIVSTSGQRHWVAAGVADVEATGAITHDQISWDPIPATYDAPVPVMSTAAAGATSIEGIAISTFVSEYPVRARIASATNTEEIVIVGTETDPDLLVLQAPLVNTYPGEESHVERLHYEWAHIWVFFYLTAAPSVAATLITQAGETVITSEGDDIIVVTDISGGGAMAIEEAERFLAIPREWSAAHIPYVTVVLLYGDGWLLGYPVPNHVLGEPGLTLGADTPIYLITE